MGGAGAAPGRGIRPGHVSGVVVVGGSVAGLTVVRELRAQGYGDSITIIDEDPAAGYRRPALSKGILDGSLDPSRVALSFPEDLGITRHQPARARWRSAADRVIEVAMPSGSSMIPFDWLVIASGLQARRLEVPGAAGAVLTLRSLADALTIRDCLRASRRVVIIGAGFLGLEIASAAASLGAEVTVLESADRPLVRAADPLLSSRIADLHASHGVRIICNTQVASVHGSTGAWEVRCHDGRFQQADLVIAAVGTSFDASWLPEHAFSLSSALMCDADGRCLDSSGSVMASTLAIGDAAAWWNPRYEQRLHVEHWTHAIEQARHVASVIAGRATAPLAAAPYFWSEQFDLRIQSVGWLAGYDDVRVVRDDGDCLILAYGRLGMLTCVAAVNYGPLLQHFRPLVEARIPLADVGGPYET